MSEIWRYGAALLPSIGVGYLFYVIIKNVLEGDRNERAALARWERATRRLRGRARTARASKRQYRTCSGAFVRGTPAQLGNLGTSPWWRFPDFRISMAIAPVVVL